MWFHPIISLTNSLLNLHIPLQHPEWKKEKEKKHNDMICREGQLMCEKKPLNERGGEDGCVPAGRKRPKDAHKNTCCGGVVQKAVAESVIYWTSKRIRAAEPQSGFHFCRLMRSPKTVEITMPSLMDWFPLQHADGRVGFFGINSTRPWIDLTRVNGPG